MKILNLIICIIIAIAITLIFNFNNLEDFLNGMVWGFISQILPDITGEY